MQAIIESFNNKELGDLLGIQIVNQQVASVLRQRALVHLDTSFTLARRKIREILNNRKVTIQPLASQMYHQHHQDVNMVLSQQGNGTTNHPNGTNNGVVVYNQNTAQTTQNNIQLKKLAFFEVMGTLMKPTELYASSQQRIQDRTYEFTLTPQQANEISLNR